jgi:hypothetical protein
LPFVGQTGERRAWHVFGPGDQLGTVNLLTAEHVRWAATLVRTGQVINFSLPLNFPIALYGGFRSGYRHHIEVTRAGRDDYVDNCAMQGSSQWDGFATSVSVSSGITAHGKTKTWTVKGS